MEVIHAVYPLILSTYEPRYERKKYIMYGLTQHLRA
jgi:hypothetical protein